MLVKLILRCIAYQLTHPIYNVTRIRLNLLAKHGILMARDLIPILVMLSLYYSVSSINFSLP